MTIMKTIAEILCISARTAPKAKGIDNILTCIIEGDIKNKLADEMDRIAKECDHKGFTRDAKGVRTAEIVIAIGTKLQPLNLKICGNCGRKNCAESLNDGVLCAIGIGDLGIALGSLVSKASDLHVDNRIMYSAGLAAKRLGLLDKDVKIVYGIPLSATGKNPFFDREVL
jgi:uncharacterized ferredoxin-like protein